MERINSRLDRSFSFETHYILGLAKIEDAYRVGDRGDDDAGPRAGGAGHVEQMRSPIGAVRYPDAG